MTDSERVWQITAPHYCAGLVVSDGMVTDAAPIICWTVGKAWRDVRNQLRAKGYSGQQLPKA